MKLKNLVSTANASIELDEIQYIATTCWFVEAHVKFILQM